jgi:hypothetical protein
VLLIALLAPAAIAQADGRVVMRDGLFYKPHEFAVSGDGDFSVQGLRWRSWGGKDGVAGGQAVEQLRPGGTNHTYPVQVTLSRRTFCARVHRTVYNTITAQIVGPNGGVLGGRMFGRVYTCAGTWQLTAGDHAGAAAGRRCSTSGMPSPVRTILVQRGPTSCAGARRLVRGWFRDLKASSSCIWADGSTHPGVCEVQAWRCTARHTIDGHTYPVTCSARAGRRRVRFINQV